MQQDPTIAKISLLLSVRRLAEARALAIEALPDSTVAPILKALIAQTFEAEGRLKEADDWVRQALEDGPECAFAHYQSARNSLRMGRLRSARESVDRAIALETYSIYFAFSSVVYSLEGDLQKARQHAEDGLLANSECSACYLAEFIATVGTLGVSDRKEKTAALLARFPESPEVLLSAGISVATYDLARGREMLALALSLRPESAPTRRIYLFSLSARTSVGFRLLCNGENTWRHPRKTGLSLGLFLGVSAGYMLEPSCYGFLVLFCAVHAILCTSICSGVLRTWSRLQLQGRARLLDEQERLLGKLGLGIALLSGAFGIALCVDPRPELAALGLSAFCSLAPLSAVGRFPQSPRWLAWASTACPLFLGVSSAGLRAANAAPPPLLVILYAVGVLGLAAGLLALEPE